MRNASPALGSSFGHQPRNGAQFFNIWGDSRRGSRGLRFCRSSHVRGEDLPTGTRTRQLLNIDAVLLRKTSGFVYAVASLVTGKPDLAYVGAFSIAIALASRIFVTPRKRDRHLALSAEQLELLRREQSGFVSNRFREIIAGWRSERVVH